ncbi:flagellar biosynthetic protein FliO [Tepidibacillus sp. LV47]|uniref:flagellar biosynthetic protein FliO n=1 Tax=Tepidibacillus sp. LV47 TaxID=3398228 RepID=UPI003AAB7ED3
MTNLGWQFFKLIFFLSLILVMIYFLFRFLSRKNGFLRSNAFQHLGGIPLGQNKSIQLVEIGQKIYVLGIGQEVRLLHIIDSQEELMQIKDAMSSLSLTNDRFIDWFKRVKVNRSHKKDSFEEFLNQKMRQLRDERTLSLQEILETSKDSSLEKIEKRDLDG